MLTSASALQATSLSLTEHSVIVLPMEADADEQLAAEELVEHLRLITGWTPAVQDEKAAIPTGFYPIRLGKAADPELDTLTLHQGDNPSAFTLRITEESTDIRGISPEGTLFGVYELLEQLGVRWFHPGELGRVIPNRSTIELRLQTTTQVPSFDQRTLQHITEGIWPRRARLGGLQRSTGAHGILPFTGRRGTQLFNENPEVYALVDGERTTRQICVGNPDTLQLAIEAYRDLLQRNPDKYIGMGPNDGGGYCECDLCTELDGTVIDPFYEQVSMTDRYIWFFNQILQELESEYPDLHIVTYIYARHMFAPNVVTPNQRIVAVFAPITLDRIRGMDNPMSPDRHILHSLIESWSEFDLNEMYYRGYYNNLACVSFPLSQIDRIRHETPVFHQLGINVMRVEVIAPSWSQNTESLYLASRMMWDIHTDVEATLEDFYQKYYGPASEAMAEYHQQLDHAFRDTPNFTGGSWPYLVIFDEQRRDTLRDALEHAASEAEGYPTYQERIGYVRMSWDRMELFLDLIAARDHFDFRTALQKTREFIEVGTVLAHTILEKCETPRLNQAMLSPRQGPEGPGNYFDRFWSPTIYQGHERTVEKGSLLYGFPDEWEALLDFVNIGEIAGYQRPGELGGNWIPLKTTSQSWSDQGFHYYRGHAWYRHTFKADSSWEDLPVYLWVGGVAGSAKVWLNGTLLGTSEEPMEGVPGIPGSFRPFDMNASPALLPGQDNTLVIKVDSTRLAEMGVGGLTAPVMLWTPHDPQWHPVHNAP